MVAAPRYGTATFIKSGDKQTVHKEIYVSDVDAAYVTWDGGNGAGSGSPSDFIPEFNLQLVDISIATGLTDTHKIHMLIAGKKTGDLLTYANHINTLSARVPLNVRCPAGLRVQFLQDAN